MLVLSLVAVVLFRTPNPSSMQQPSLEPTLIDRTITPPIPSFSLELAVLELSPVEITVS